MGRPKRYDTQAEKQAAYRARKKGGDATCRTSILRDATVQVVEDSHPSSAAGTVQAPTAAKLRDEDVGGMLCAECGGYEAHVDGCSSFPAAPPAPPKKHWVKDEYSQ